MLLEKRIIKKRGICIWFFRIKVYRWKLEEAINAKWGLMTFLYLEFMRKSNSKTINSISKTSNRNSVLLSNSKKNAILKMEFVYNTDAFVFSSTLKKNSLKVFNKSKQIKMMKIIFIEFSQKNYISVSNSSMLFIWLILVFN